MAGDFIAKLRPKLAFLNHLGKTLPGGTFLTFICCSKGTRYFKNEGDRNVSATLRVLYEQVVSRVRQADPTCRSEVVLANDYMTKEVLPDDSSHTGSTELTRPKQSKATHFQGLDKTPIWLEIERSFNTAENLFVANQQMIEKLRRTK
jgi:hypothetical protein